MFILYYLLQALPRRLREAGGEGQDYAIMLYIMYNVM